MRAHWKMSFRKLLDYCVLKFLEHRLFLLLVSFSLQACLLLAHLYLAQKRFLFVNHIVSLGYSILN